MDKQIEVKYRNEVYMINAYLDAQGAYVLSHRNLKDCFFDALRKYEDIKVEKKPIDTSITHCIAQCEITSKDFHMMPFTGEVTTKSLNDIVRDTPYVVAENRALDKAIIAFFNLKERLYSDNDIPVMYSDYGVDRNIVSPEDELRNEFKALGNVSVMMNGQPVFLRDMSDADIQSLLAVNGDAQLAVIQNSARRFLEIRGMLI